MKKSHSILQYTLLFLLILPLCWLGLILSGHAPIWEVDGLMQHFPFFVYIGQWLRDALHALFTGEAIRLFDFSLGFGEDVLSAVNYYGLGDPLALISAFFCGDSAELGYSLLLIIRSWCAGLACMALAHHFGFSWKQTLLSGLLYAFSLGLFVSAVLRHAMFASPYIHLPLMLLGLEHVFDRRRPWLLSLSVALSALCGFYFLYCNSLLLLIYALIRQFTRGEPHPLRTLPMTALRAVGWYALGIGLAAVIFLPATLGFLSGQRLSGAMSADGVRLHYSLWEYLRFPLSMLSDRITGAVQFVPALTLFGGALLLAKDRRGWRAILLAGLLMLLIPAVGWALNGFSYETTRWSYAVSLLAAMVAGKSLPLLLCAGRRTRIGVTVLGALLLLYLPIAAFLGLHAALQNLLIAAAAVLMTLAALWLYWTLPARRFAAAALCCAVALNVALGHFGAWRTRADTAMPAGESAQVLFHSPFAGLEPAEGRTDADVTVTGFAINAAAIEGVSATAVYNSTISGSYHGFLSDVACPGLLQVNAIAGLDGRAALEALWSVSRWISSGDGDRVPYGFEPAGDSVYENTLALPIGCARTGILSRADYDALSPLEKQWALLQCAVLDGAETTAAPELSVREIPVLSVEMEHISADGELLTADEGAVIRLTFDAPAGCELYLQMENLACLDGLIDLGNRLRLDCGGATATLTLVREGIEQDLGREFCLVNLGYGESARSALEIRFDRAGRYRLGKMTLLAQPMDGFDGLIHTLQGRGLTDVKIETNRISGRASLDEPGVMVFAIPCSDGWSAQVDGESAAVTDSAGTFLAVPMTAGDHEIVLTYRTPGLNAGAAVSAAALALLLGIIIAGRRRRSAAKGA